MTDIHDIQPIVGPDWWPLIVGIVIIAVIAFFILRWILGILQKRKIATDKIEKREQFPREYKSMTLTELRSIQAAIPVVPDEELVQLTSRFHHALKWYLSCKVKQMLLGKTLRELGNIIPPTFNQFFTFVYTMIYPWQKRTRMELTTAIEQSIKSVQDDI